MRPARLLRPALACAALAAAAGALVLCQPALPRSAAQWAAWSHRTSPDEAIVTVAALAAWLVLAWLAAGSALVVAARLPGAAGRAAGTAARIVTPLALRRVLEAAVGVTVAVGPLAAATPATAGGAGPVVTDLPSLDRPAAALPARPAVADDAVLVRPGETLWGLAARHLGPGATAEQVAAAWPRWYAANRDVIGPDPDLIHPGQRLHPPR